MPNIALLSDQSPQMAQVHKSVLLQTSRVAVHTYPHSDAISTEIDVVYAAISNEHEHLEAVSALVVRLALTPVVACVSSSYMKLAVKAMRVGASDMLLLSGDQADDAVEIANSVYRAIRRRQTLIAGERLLHLPEESRPHEAEEELPTGLFDQMNQAVIVLDREAAVTSLNHAAEELLGKPEADMRRRDISLFVNISMEDKEKVFLRGIEHRGEMQLKHGDQDSTIGYSLAPRRQADGSLNGAMMMFKDITQVKQKRLQAEKTEKIQTLGAIAAAISHEVKNPLAGIKSMVQAVLIDLKPDTETFHYLKRISQEVDRINTFIESTFAFARHKRPRTLKVEITDVISSVASLLTENFKTKKVKFVRHFAAGLPSVKVDPDQIHQVMLNIMLNAVEAMAAAPRTEGGSTLEAVTQQATVIIDGEAKPFVEVLFHDNGPGISDANLAKLFDPFFTTKPSGTGLGLAISYKIMSEHQGFIEIGNRDSGGTTVGLKFPLAPTSRF